jgi:hypothetical protein
MATVQHVQLRPARLRELLDPIIRQELDMLDIRPATRSWRSALAIGGITACLARLVGPFGMVSTVDKDTSHRRVGPTGRSPRSVMRCMTRRWLS